MRPDDRGAGKSSRQRQLSWVQQLASDLGVQLSDLIGVERRPT